MAISQRTPDLMRDAPPMRVVPRPLRSVPDSPPRDDLGDEFLFTGGALSKTTRSAPRIRPRLLIRALLGAGLLIAAVLVVRNMTASKPTPARVTVQSAPAAARVAPPTRAAPTAVPMSVVSSTLSPMSAGQNYSATVAVRNPTDVAADAVMVLVTLRDGAGRVIATQARSLGTVASGETVKLTISGELDPSAGLPSALEVSAAAARLETPA